MKQTTKEITEEDNSTSVDLFKKIVDFKKIQYVKNKGPTIIPLTPLLIFFIISSGAFLGLVSVDVGYDTVASSFVAAGLIISALIAVFCFYTFSAFFVEEESSIIYKDYKGLACGLQKKFNINSDVLIDVVYQKSIVGFPFYVIDNNKLEEQIATLEKELLTDETNESLSKKMADIAAYIDNAGINENSLKFKTFSNYAKKVSGDDNKAQRLITEPTEPTSPKLTIIEDG